MEQSLLAAVSGIDADQTYLDVLGNNVANSNTTAYKNEDANFTDLLAQQLTGASAPTTETGGINPVAIGAGVQIGSITEDETQGDLITTNEPTDLAIQGNGYLVADTDGQTLYTRDGSLTTDATGQLTTASGALIQGWVANAAGAINSNAPTTSITIPTGETMKANPTTEITMTGNLPLWDGSGDSTPVSTTINAFDAPGTTVPVTLDYTPVTGSANTWTIQGTVANPSGGTTNLWTTPPTMVFNPTTGEIKSITGATTNGDGSLSLPVTNMPAGYTFPTTDTWNIDFPSPTSATAVTQYAGEQTLAATGQDGYESGILDNFSIGSDGTITGAFSNGQNQAIGQIALATFANPSGLADEGNSMYQYTANSGQANVGTPNTGSRGTLVGGSLEGSNVDLATELTDLIVAQEAYQANTKVVSTTQTVLGALMQDG